MSKESISIIIPAYHSQHFIKECLDSLITQTYFHNFNDFEILLGIDGDSDMLKYVKEIKDTYKNLQVYFIPEN